MDIAVRVDTSGAYCPVPILEIAKVMRRLPVGALVELISTDRGLEADLPAWCEATGHELVRLERRGTSYVGWVRKAG
ncbi:sulfurtransferase TusA family protein [Myxococcus sp. CA051A]|uniref:sulfurtransferase TusA family protein n=1 Tax=unclassified Myxococcus TaxID=2648731 RepID=UPI00157A7CE9|nr:MULTISPECIES: sulfurtransferase TusA family protein [unclassified Myxococcus]NTX40599.1 sulfurtransferase TusA family protein [Myxococcus sp. CA033]NTX57343.1 sulfurtransferase TusA family protein [Myxococcus sp. CA039A]NTX66620.1 sulfurtransferase TusA family protein [Myxococcus sp. CA051A]